MGTDGSGVRTELGVGLPVRVRSEGKSSDNRERVANTGEATLDARERELKVTVRSVGSWISISESLGVSSDAERRIAKTSRVDYKDRRKFVRLRFRGISVKQPHTQPVDSQRNANSS
jgi:hypothetical protein